MNSDEMGTLPAVRLIVDCGESDPSLITEMIGLQPTSIAASGWSTSRSGRAASRSTPLRSVLHTDGKRWIFVLPQAPKGPLNEQFTALLRVLETHPAGIRNVSSRFRATVSITLDSADSAQADASQPAFEICELPASAIKSAASLGLSVRFVAIHPINDD